MRSVLYLAIAATWLVGCGEASWELDATRGASLDRVLQSAVAAGDVPGAVALVTTRDSILYHRAFGILDPVGAVPMRSDAIFPIASMTKPITSLAIMMLVEEGRIGLDEPASRYLPELRDRAVLVGVDSVSRTALTRPSVREVTVRDLLRHTSGFGYGFSSSQVLELTAQTDIPPRMQPLLHDPGARWTYGMGTAHLGWILEEVTGTTLPQFLQARIFGPLGMVDTSYDLAPEKSARLVAQFRRQDGQLTASPRPDSIRGAGRGDGGLLSTARDYARFVQLVLGRGERAGVRLISEASWTEMTSNQLGDLTVVEQPGADPALSAAFPLGAGRDGFGLGFQVAQGDGADGRADGSLSWAGLQNTHFWIDPQNGIGVVLLFQVLPFYDSHVITVLREFERTLYAPES